MITPTSMDGLPLNGAVTAARGAVTVNRPSLAPLAIVLSRQPPSGKATMTSPSAKSPSR